LSPQLRSDPSSTGESDTCLLLPPLAFEGDRPRLLDRKYRKQLEARDARQVAQEPGSDAILLCWEAFNVRCHRRLLAEWLEEKLGVVVPELGHERAESIPFSEQPSKWTASPLRGNCPMTF
jgi:hypothetical protein